MSDITINMVVPEESPQTPSTRKWKKKEKWLRRKMQNFVNRGSHQGTQNRLHQMPSQNWKNQQTHHTSTPDRPLTTGASHCPPKPSALTHSTPSLTVTVNNKKKVEKQKAQPSDAGPSGSSSSRPTPAGNPTKYLAIDCEMVGTGPKGCVSQLARCSIVSYEGDVVYDKFIRPSMPVTDYRTRWSGIRERDLRNATPFSQARKEILKLLMGKVVIGHAVHNDFKAITYCHPAALTRDTSRIPLLNKKAGFPETQSASLKRLTKAIFNRDIQVGRKGHSSVEDAQATMELYKVVEEEWERKLAADAQA